MNRQCFIIQYNLSNGEAPVLIEGTEKGREWWADYNVKHGVLSEVKHNVEVEFNDGTTGTMSALAVSIPKQSKVEKVHATAHSDDRVIEITFDASPWLAQADEKELVELVKCGWGGDYPADIVVKYIADSNLDEKAVELFTYLHIIKKLRSKKDCNGFECHVSEESALSWLEKNRPDMFASLKNKDLTS